MTSPEFDPTTPNTQPDATAAPTYSDAAYQGQVYQAPGSAAPDYSAGGTAAYPAPGYPATQGYPPAPGYPAPAAPQGYPAAPQGYAPQGAYPYPAGYPVYNPAAQTNTMAILSLVFAFVFAPLAIVFGHMARKQIRERGEGGAGLATAGLWCGYIFTSAWVLICGVYVAVIGFYVSSGAN